MSKGEGGILTQIERVFGDGLPITFPFFELYQTELLNFIGKPFTR